MELIQRLINLGALTEIQSAPFTKAYNYNGLTLLKEGHKYSVTNRGMKLHVTSSLENNSLLECMDWIDNKMLSTKKESVLKGLFETLNK